MNNLAKNIVQQLFGVSSLSEVNSSELAQVASKHPYFGAVQFLLAQKMKEAHHYEADDQLKKAALYFTNPFWLNYLLHENEIAEAKDEIADDEIPNSLQEDALISIEEKDEIVVAPEVKHDEVVEEIDEIIPAIEIIEEPEVDEIIPAIEVANDELYDIPDEIVPAVEVESAIIQENYEEPEEDLLQNNEDEAQRLKLSSLIEQHLAEFKKPVDEKAELPIKSAPYHTVDYFASQGIKADGQDKFSSRVRKFTDWLKQMKVATPQPTDLGTDAETEQMIETIAKSSNETKDIITEAMAEVLVKQGKLEKAIQLYKKLSFLNPAKSTYFAAKIEDLNNK